MQGDTIEIKDENGVAKKYSVLFKFDEQNNNEKYIVYTDYTTSEDGNYNIYARQYIEKDGNMELTIVKNEAVKKFIETKLKELILK